MKTEKPKTQEQIEKPKQEEDFLDSYNILWKTVNGERVGKRASFDKDGKPFWEK